MQGEALRHRSAAVHLRYSNAQIPQGITIFVCQSSACPLTGCTVTLPLARLGPETHKSAGQGVRKI